MTVARGKTVDTVQSKLINHDVRQACDFNTPVKLRLHPTGRKIAADENVRCVRSDEETVTLLHLIHSANVRPSATAGFL